MINWRLRLLSPTWWMGVIPAGCLLVQAILQPFGVDWDFESVRSYLLSLVEIAFAFLFFFSASADPTTQGWGDSFRALKREVPAPNAAQEIEEGSHE